VLAYVFWHAPAAGVEAEYEAHLGRFLAALEAARVPGLIRCWTERVDGAPWLAGPGYADWYLVESFAALGTMNHAAVTGTVGAAHDRIARLAGPGAGSILGLVRGDGGPAARWVWRSKPRGMSYEAFYRTWPAAVTAWRRQLVLGPTPEFALADGPALTLEPGDVVTHHTVVGRGDDADA
jgi:hypothetical protein